MNAPTDKTPVTLTAIQKMAASGERFAMLTCYDATTARWLERAGVPALLVGDTAAEMILGFDRTLHAPLDFMVQITAAVKRGAPGCFVMGDMPFMSYQADDAEAVRNAGRFLTEGHADAVKLELGPEGVGLVSKLAAAGIPVVAHIGSRPQQAALQGGYKAAGKTADEARALVELAGAMAQAGAVMLLLEATTARVSQRVVETVGVPVIGCGAGPACHGEVVVLHDLLGLTDWQPPFAPPRAAVGQTIQDAAAEWVRRVAATPSDDAHPYTMPADEAERFDRD